MSRRAASRGGFCADSANAARVMYGSAVVARCVKIAGATDYREDGSNRTDEDPAVEDAAPEQQVAERAPGENAEDPAGADDGEHVKGAESLVDAVFTRRRRFRRSARPRGRSSRRRRRSGRRSS